MAKRSDSKLKAVTEGWIRLAKAAIETGDFGSHQVIADKVGISQGYLSGILKGRYQTSKAVDKLSEFLGLEDATIEVATPTLRELMEVAVTKDEDALRHVIALLKTLPDA